MFKLENVTRPLAVLEGYPGDNLRIVDTNYRVMPYIVTLNQSTNLTATWTYQNNITVNISFSNEVTEEDPISVHVAPYEEQDIQIDSCIYSPHAFYYNAELDPAGFVFGKRYTLTFQKAGYKDYKLSFRAYY